MESSRSPPESTASVCRQLALLPEVWPLLDGHRFELATVDVAPTVAALERLAEGQVLVIDGRNPRHRGLVGRIRPERRPAVVALGLARVDLDVADEWVGQASELESRAQLAIERARRRRALARRAFTDFLTGLPNRRALVGHLVREWRRSRREQTPLALALLDLDHFKEVNERLGHPAGDRLLRRVGAALRAASRGHELVGRVGGDEFALVVSGDQRSGELAAERLCASLETIGVRASHAAADLHPGERLLDLYRRTDAALKLRKDRRRRERAGKQANDRGPGDAGLASEPEALSFSA